MNVRKWWIAILVAVTMAGLAPETSQAQLFGRRGGGVGYGYGGYGYGSGWGWGTPGYYGWNNGLGYGGYGYGNRYSYPSYYNTYSSTPIVTQPMYGGTTSTYQSFYPPSTTTTGVVGQAYDPCCCSGSGTTQMAGVNQSGGTLVVNVPENAQLFWNGTTPMAGSGASRRFTLQATSAPQRIEARWTGPDGKTVTETREVIGRPNDTVTVDFTSNGVNGTNGINNTGGINGTNGVNGTNSTNGTNNPNGINDGRNKYDNAGKPEPEYGPAKRRAP